MYLLEIDEKTGLVKNTPTLDSWKGIKVFRDLVEKQGLEALTVIAFAVDYESPFRHYKESDRIYRAMEEVYGDRKKFKVDSDAIKEVLEKYHDLQFNEDLEQHVIFRNIKINILDKLSQANRQNDDAEINLQTKNLQRHEETLSKFKERFVRDKALEHAVTNNGYELSRIENDIRTRKNSKFKDANNAKNPDQLGLEN